MIHRYIITLWKILSRYAGMNSAFIADGKDEPNSSVNRAINFIVDKLMTIVYCSIVYLG